MDDFRVGSVPPPAPFDDRRPTDKIARRREHHHEDQRGEGQDEPEDVFEAADAGEAEPAPAVPIEDYYVPSDPDDAGE